MVISGLQFQVQSTGGDGSVVDVGDHIRKWLRQEGTFEALISPNNGNNLGEKKGYGINNSPKFKEQKLRLWLPYTCPIVLEVSFLNPEFCLSTENLPDYLMILNIFWRQDTYITRIKTINIRRFGLNTSLKIVTLIN